MGKKTSRRNQKLYKMKGCSKNTRKNYLGGSSSNMNLAYTGNNIPKNSNPFLSYTGKGGSCNSNLTPSLEIPVNINASEKTIPNTGPSNIFPATPFLNASGSQRGGGCGCGMPLMTGGSCGTCGIPLMTGGVCKRGGGNDHRIGCKCSTCKMMGGRIEGRMEGRMSKMMGGRIEGRMEGRMSKMMGGRMEGRYNKRGGNQGIPYANGLTGSPWTPSVSGWPGVDGIQGDRNFIAPNNYHTDIQRSIISTGANPPFSIGGKGSRKKRGGTLSNFLGQDLINLGRQFQFNSGSAYNALTGYAAPTNPMPWKGQLPNTPSLSTIRSASL